MTGDDLDHETGPGHVTDVAVTGRGQSLGMRAWRGSVRTGNKQGCIIFNLPPPAEGGGAKI